LLELPYLKDTDMSIGQVQKFINQVKQKNIRLKRIQILGGEPLLHPKLNDFISMLFYDLMVPGNLLRIDILTNGIINAEAILEECKKDVKISEAFINKKIVVIKSPEGKEKTFMHALSAPIDLGHKWDICNWPRDCGVLINTYGYWPGGACGPIALLFGIPSYARFYFPVKFKKTWPNLKEDICRYCAAGCCELRDKKTGYVTDSYKKAIHNWITDKFSVPVKF